MSLEEPASYCHDRGPWCECARGFRRWIDQQECRYARRNEHADQCLWVTECGFCGNIDAQREARGK